MQSAWNRSLRKRIPNFEIILVDDGSTDNSGKMCDTYAEQDTRVRVFHKPNGGQSEAHNLGVAYAKGDLVAFIDSDDLAKKLEDIAPGCVVIPVDHITEGAACTALLAEQLVRGREFETT